MNPRRVRTLKIGRAKKGLIAYWMSRDQRVRDNWALLFAQDLALKNRLPLCVLFVLVPEFLGATMRQFQFMLRGLREVEAGLEEKNIPFVLLMGSPGDVIPQFIDQYEVSALVKDFDPLRLKMQWTDAVRERIDIPFYEVDAHNIVPCWVASSKQEFGAYTLRPKIRRLLPEFLEDFPPLRRHPVSWSDTLPLTDWEESTRAIRAAPCTEVSWIKPGEKAAMKRLRDFVARNLEFYAAKRNDPSVDGQSNLSPYIHFGQIAAQRIALEVSRAPVGKDSRESFLEELIVRKELADNFCFYNAGYDSFSGFPDWAKRSLDAHRKDGREYLYSREEFKHAKTHDALWNAAQREMVTRGKMHGYMRMYWAKKILEWTESPEIALQTAIYLNDKYELDGRDPNGYAGISWSIGGVHDRAWADRPVFGKIRYMSFRGCASKFDVDAYIERFGDEGRESA